MSSKSNTPAQRRKVMKEDPANTSTKGKQSSDSNKPLKRIQKSEQHRSESVGRKTISSSKDQHSKRTVSVDRGMKRDDESKKKIVKNSVKKKTESDFKQSSKHDSTSVKKQISMSGGANSNSVQINKNNHQKVKQSVDEKISGTQRKKVKHSSHKNLLSMNSDKNKHLQLGNYTTIKTGKFDDIDSLSHDETLERPRTSTIKKSTFLKVDDVRDGMKTSGSPSYTEETKRKEFSFASSASDDGAYSYEEDFEEYESDFEENDSGSVISSENENSIEKLSESEAGDNEMALRSFPGIVQPTIVKQQSLKPSKIAQKNARTEFLKMSSRSSTFLILEDSSVPSECSSSLPVSNSFINFAAAIEQQEKKKHQSRMLKRGKELLELVKLDEMKYEIFEMPPMKYDVFIKSFGKLDSKQEYVQTENTEEEEVQTDRVEVLEKWTQHPSSDNMGVGGEGCFVSMKHNSDGQSYLKSYAAKLQKYLQNVSPVIFSLLNEHIPHEKISYSEVKDDNNFSTGSFKFLPVPICDGLPVLYISYCSGTLELMLSIHGRYSEGQNTVVMDDGKGIICVWNIFKPHKPEHILTSNSQASCACFGPDGSDTIIAGMVDGSLMLWDLAEAVALHQIYVFRNHEVPLRYATFNTAPIAEECHKSCVIAVHHLKGHLSRRSNNRIWKMDFRECFSVISLEEMGVINIWTAVELPIVNTNDVELDMGLAPGGRMKLILRSAILLGNINYLSEHLRNSIRVFDLSILTSDVNHVLIATDFDKVLHLNQSGHKNTPRFYDCKSEFPTELQCISCSPHKNGYFLVGGRNGNVMLFELQRSSPLKTIFQAANGEPVICLKWSCTHPSVFYVLGCASSFHIWDLNKDILKSQYSYSFSEPKVVWFDVYSTQKLKSKSRDYVPSHMVFAKTNGEIEIHAMNSTFDKISEQEYNEELEMLKSL